MLLKTLKAKNTQGSLLLTLDNPSNGYIVQKIEGLGPVKATMSSTSFANMDGAQYHTSKRETRNLVISLGLDPDYSPTYAFSLRQALYNFFMPKTNVTLEFVMAGEEPSLVREIEGRIESFEPDIFTKDPAVNLSIICFEPDFVDPQLKLHNWNTVTGTTTNLFTYNGTVESGFIFKLNFNRNVGDTTLIRLRHIAVNPEGANVTSLLDISNSSYPPGFSFQSGDQLQISSIRGSKYVRVVRGSTIIPILYAMSPVSPWLELLPGQNRFGVQVSGSAIPYTIEYFERHGGL